MEGRSKMRFALLLTRSIGSALSGLLLVAVIAHPAIAFDGKRRGFVLEMGIGPGFSYSVHHDIRTSTDRQEFGFAGLTRVRLGVGVSDRLMITYVNDVAWTFESYKVINEVL